MSGTVFSGSAVAYEQFMGRYSRQLATPFADFAGLGSGMRALDVGAGTGALTEELIKRVGVGLVAAAEPSPDYATALRERYPEVDVRLAPAEELPWDADTFDVTLAQLVVSFMSDALQGARELARVLRPGGTAATCMWELDGMDAANAMREVRRQLQPGEASPIATAFRDEQSLRELFEGAGLGDVETTIIEVSVTYASVDELWEPAIRVGGPGGPAVDQFSAEQLARARSLFEEVLGSAAKPFTLSGRAAAVRGVRL
jgi:ubiquinone/menaquinone biosynthesis C-methylase UbiE